MDNGPEVSEAPRSSNNKFFLLLSLVILLAAFLTGAFYFFNIIKNQSKKNLTPAPIPVKKSLKIPGFQLVSEGIVLNKKADFFTVKENAGVETVILLNPKVSISLHTVQTASSSGIIVSRLFSQEKIDYSKIAVNDKIRVNLDEKDGKLIAELIIVFREKK